MFLSLFSGPWPIMYYLPSTYGSLADFVAIHGFLYILTKLAYLQGLPIGMPRRELVSHTSVGFFSGHGISFKMEIGSKAFFPTTSILHRTDFHFDHFHSGFVKHLAADSSQFLGQTSQENCKSFSIIVSACALFGCALNTEAKTMFFLMKSMAIGI